MTAFTLRTHANRNENGRVVRYAPGDVVDIVGDAEIERLVRAGAIALDEPEFASVDDDGEPTEGEPTEGVDGEGSDSADDEADDQDPARPRKAGPRDAWIEYAVSKGVDREHAESLTKAELIAEVGE